MVSSTQHALQPNTLQGGILGYIFAMYVLQASQNPYPIVVYAWSIMGLIIDPHLGHFWASDIFFLSNSQKSDPILVTKLKMPDKWGYGYLLVSAG